MIKKMALTKVEKYLYLRYELICDYFLYSTYLSALHVYKAKILLMIELTK